MAESTLRILLEMLPRSRILHAQRVEGRQVHRITQNLFTNMQRFCRKSGHRQFLSTQNLEHLLKCSIISVTNKCTFAAEHNLQRALRFSYRAKK